MRFNISRASDATHNKGRVPVEGSRRDGERWSIEIADLQQLLELARLVKADLIVGYDPPRIIIYDSHVE
jgi:hypothetical protein